MPFNILLLPLLGGYVFITNWNHTRYYTKRYSGERLIFHAACAGVLFLAAAFLITILVGARWPDLVTRWRAAVPFSYSGTSALAFLIGATAWVPLNTWVHKRDAEVQTAIREWNDFLEVLLQRSLRETKQVSITTKSSKVYIGFVTANFDPSFERRYIALLPLLSGYRTQEEQKLVITTDYVDVYQKMIEDANEFLLSQAEDFQVILPVSEIASANIFDPIAYEKFNAPDPIS